MNKNRYIFIYFGLAIYISILVLISFIFTQQIIPQIFERYLTKSYLDILIVLIIISLPYVLFVLIQIFLKIIGLRKNAERISLVTTMIIILLFLFMITNYIYFISHFPPRSMNVYAIPTLEKKSENPFDLYWESQPSLNDYGNLTKEHFKFLNDSLIIWKTAFSTINVFSPIKYIFFDLNFKFSLIEKRLKKNNLGYWEKFYAPDNEIQITVEVCRDSIFVPVYELKMDSTWMLFQYIGEKGIPKSEFYLLKDML
jgi:hypothetical protein